VCLHSCNKRILEFAPCLLLSSFLSRNPYSYEAVVLSIHQPPTTLPHKPLCIFTLGGRVSCYFKSPEYLVQVAIGNSKWNNDSVTNVPGNLAQAIPPRNWIREILVSNLKVGTEYPDRGARGSPALLAKYRFSTSRWRTTASFHIAYSSLFHVKWVPVTTALCVLRLRMEERPPIWRVAANEFNKQSWTADEGWSSSSGVGRGANNPPRENPC
jgi:hypothetical protein